MRLNTWLEVCIFVSAMIFFTAQPRAKEAVHQSVGFSPAAGEFSAHLPQTDQIQYPPKTAAIRNNLIIYLSLLAGRNDAEIVCDIPDRAMTPVLCGGCLRAWPRGGASFESTRSLIKSRK